MAHALSNYSDLPIAGPHLSRSNGESGKNYIFFKATEEKN